MKYTIAVRRVSVSCKDIEVEADTLEEAENKAIGEAGNVVFDNESYAEYELDD